MKAQLARFKKTSDSMILAVALIATVYWVLDSILNIFFSKEFNLIAQLIGPDLYDIYIRVVVLCLLVILGSHAQSIINRLKETTRRLNESEELWRSLVETAPDVIMTVDHSGMIRFINHPLLGVSPEKVIGRSLCELLPASYRPTAQDIIKNVFQSGGTDMFEVCMEGKPAPAWYTFRVGPLRLDQRVIAATIISTNTTDFKRAEEFMRYKELFENVGDCVFILNQKGIIVECNDRVRESMGFEPSELVGKPIRQLAMDDQAALPPAAAPGGARFELNLKTKAGRAVSYDIHCRPIVYLGELCHLWVARDITPTQQLQDCLIRSERLAITGQLAASIAHEINSPLQGITALLSTLGSAYGKDEYLQEKLKLIDGAFNSIRDTVRNLIDLNRPGKEKKQLVDMHQVIGNTVALVRSLLQKNLITARLTLEAAQTTLFASAQQMGQVLMNLINNAVEAITSVPGYFERVRSEPGAGGTIAIRTFNRGNEFVIEFEDSGPGIPPDDLQRIFDPFFTSQKAGGLGVGLAICHGIITDHRGAITAANAPGGGAVFTVALPLRHPRNAIPPTP